MHFWKLVTCFLLIGTFVSRALDGTSQKLPHGAISSSLQRIKRANEKKPFSNVPPKDVHNDIGLHSSENSSKSKKSNKLKAERIAERNKRTEKEKALKKDLISVDPNRFEGKHLYLNGKEKDINGNPQNSFKELSSDPKKAKKYLIDLNKKLYKGGILPRVGNFEAWLQKVKLTIIDADIDVLITDISKKFNEWKAGSASVDGKLTPGTKLPNIMTEKAYTVTDITFQLDDQGNVKVMAEQIETKVELGPDENGKPSHFEKMNPEESERQTMESRKEITKFTRRELEVNAKVTQKFWKNLGVNEENILLNEKSAIYQGFNEIANEEFTKQMGECCGDGANKKNGVGNLPGACVSGGRKKRAAGIGRKCAIMLSPSGDVESVSPKQFNDEFKKASDFEKSQMAELVKKNKDKILKNSGDDVDGKKMKNLMDLEWVKSHVGALDAVNQVEHVKKVASGGEEASKKSSRQGSIVEGLEKQLRKVEGKMRVSGTKLARGLSRIVSSQAAKRFSKGLSKVTNSLSQFFLAKTVVNGIIQGDTTSLAIVGALVGYEIATGTAIKMGAKYFSAASKVGKATKFLGDVAGPIGASFDIGLSVYSLTKSIERLINATNKYDRDDAIADIISESVDIAVTATVTTLSIIYPPVAPFIIAIGAALDLMTKLAVAIFKSFNVVARIDAQVPLLDFEKDYVFSSRFFDWFGLRQPDYIDSLLKEKAANDLAVQKNLAFLEKNTQFLGIVFPSRTLYFDGGCELTQAHCALKNAWGCSKWEPRYTLGRKCSHRRSCGNKGRICDNYWKGVGEWGYDDFKCECSGEKTTFGNARSNSHVDLRKKQRVYWERSVPSEVSNGVFLCKPGDLSYVDYKVSQENFRTEYYCKHAIGLLQPHNRRYAGQAMLYYLEDGDDKVYPAENATPNIYIMGNDGVKYYYGAGGRDEFLFDSDCSKSLRGYVDGEGGEEDTITFGENCTKGEEIKINFVNGKITTKYNRLDMRIYDIEQFNGRQGQAESIEIACNTRKVLGRGGGSYSQMDHVRIQNKVSCVYNVTIFGAAYTKITSTAKQGNVVIPIDDPWNGMDVELLVRPRELKLSVVFLKTTASQMTSYSVEAQGENQLKLNILAFSNTQRIQFTFNFDSAEKDMFIYFTEHPSGSNSVLFLSRKTNGGTSVVFYHFLSQVGTSQWRTGSKCIENVFDVSGSNWLVTGGDKADEFILKTATVGMVDGGGGVDTLKFSGDYNNDRVLVLVDLTSSKFRNLENVYGLAGVPLRVITGCDTLLVATQGGSSTETDIITVPSQQCSQRNLQILAVGHTRINWNGGRGEVSNNDLVKVLVNGNDGGNELKFELNVESVKMANLYVIVMLSHRSWKVVEAKKSIGQQSVFVYLAGYSTAPNAPNEWIKFNLTEDLNADGPYLTSPLIQIEVGDHDDNEVHGTLMFDRQTLAPKMMFEVSGYETAGSATGMESLENVFKLNASEREWRVTGGNKDDLFVIYTTETYTGARYLVSGGSAGDDTLIMENGNESNSDPTFVINLPKAEIGYLTTSPENRGKVWHINRIFGRQNAPDVIHPDCSTKMINGRGGRGPGHEKDIIQISFPRCNGWLEMVVEKFTTVRSTALWGRFTYYVQDLLTNSLELTPTNENRHLIKFSFYPWKVITAVSFNESTQAMGWKISGVNGEHEDRVQVFPLSRSSNSKDYNNPIFEFHTPGSSVSSDIRVGAGGVTMATFMVHGDINPDVIMGLPVDVNRFLINITNSASATLGSSKPSSSNGGTIQGCSDGNRCSANQFWILNLEHHLEMLDGGACRQQENECTNYLHFSESAASAYEEQIHVDLDIAHGSVRTNSGVELISHLKNMHELHGTRGIVAYATCATSQVSGVDQIVVKAGEGCSLNLIIGLEEYTKVWFVRDDVILDPKLTDVDFEEEGEEVDDIPESTVHYRFARPMSFELNGDYAAILSHNHNIFLPFKLSDLNRLHFDLEQEQLNYSISGNNTSYYISMISAPGYDEQFYSQPNIVTKDGFQIQIARDGSLWTFFGNSNPSTEASAESVPELQNLANLLGITMVLEKAAAGEFYFIGHNTTAAQDRNVLQNLANYTSHLAGGGSNDTIYEISHLDKDVYIHTGFTTNSEEFYDKLGSKTTTTPKSKEDAKQTIDLTDVVVPIRQMSATKYVPKVNLDGDNLAISMEGYENMYPGKVVIVSGAKSGVAKNIQLLLNNALMDLVPAEEGTEFPTENEQNSTKRQKRSLNEDTIQWNIHPRPVIIPQDITIFSLSPEDLEDGHDIQFEELPENNETTDSSSAVNKGDTFNAVRNGSDLYLTNIVNQVGTGELKTVIISDFYYKPTPSPPQSDLNINIKSDVNPEFNATSANQHEEQPEDNDMPASILGVTIHLPGLNLMLNESEVLVMSTNGSEDGDNNSTEGPVKMPYESVRVISFEKVLYKVEDELLQDMPDMKRTFWSETLAAEDAKDTSSPYAWIYILVGFLLLVAVSIGLVTSCLVWYSARKGSYHIRNGVPTENNKQEHIANEQFNREEGLELVPVKSFSTPELERALLGEVDQKDNNQL